ncbi:MAG: Exocyst complex component 5 [Phylliscum demangeonii]|nr:MAG: Exocyst complex component 5 [Phylliscum demangeonii]
MATATTAPTTAPPAGRSIFPKGPEFTLENFSSKDFIVNDFVESLASSALPANRRSAPTLPSPGAGAREEMDFREAAFDPKPFIRTFEHALTRLESLSADLNARETELQTAVRRTELQHSQTLESLGRKLEQNIDSFQHLDSSLGQVARANEERERSSRHGAGVEPEGNVAVRIGGRLEELDQQSRRARDAQFLIKCWMELAETGELAALENVRLQGGGGEGMVRCALLVRQLTRISQKLDPASWSQTNGDHRAVNGVDAVNGAHDHAPTRCNTREIIEKFAETLEKDLLKQFDDFYRRQNFAGMRDCANALQEFHGGANVVALFVNQHQFFIDGSQLGAEEIDGDQEIWERLGDPDADPPGVEPSLKSLVDEVKVIVQEESFIIRRAFPYYELVLGRFLQRIQQRLEMVLDKASAVSSLAFLRSLQAARSYIHSLIDDLKSHGLTEHPDPASSPIAQILDQQVDELFVPYLVGYIEREKRSLEELYSSLLFKFTIYHSRRKKLPSTFMASLAKSGSELLASARDAYTDRLASSDLTSSQKARLLRVAGLKDGVGGEDKHELEVSDVDGVLSVAIAKRSLRWLAESVGRDLELSGGSETPKDVSVLLRLLLANLGEIYVQTALDGTVDIASGQESGKNEPDLSYLPKLRPAIAIMHLMMTCIQTVLLPLAAPNLTVRREMERRAHTAVNQMEEKISSVMQHTVDSVLAWTGKLLQGQKKTDFRPKDGALEGSGGWLAMLQTPTCLAACTFLAKAKESLAQALDGQNIEHVSTEIAIGVRSQLLDHFRKFQVNAAGGLMVTKDLTQYAATLRSLSVTPSFLPSLDVLSEIGNLFVIGPDALRERLRGGALGLLGVEKAHLKPYIVRREDAASVGVQSILSGL